MENLRPEEKRAKQAGSKKERPQEEPSKPSLKVLTNIKVGGTGTGSGSKNGG